MKANIVKTGILTTTGLLILVVAAAVIVSSCKKEDVVEAINGGNSSGSDTIDTRSGGAWSFDKFHSNVMWETLYYGDNAILSGRFNNFKMTVYFDQAKPENSTIDAWVQLSTFNTGEPGRDSYGKCGPGYMGVKWDTTWIDTVNYTLTPQAATDTAWYTSTSVEPYGNGYLAKGNLNFRGVTKPVDLFFSYAGQHKYTSQTGTITKAGFTGEFTINAISDFGVTSTSIADKVKIRIDCNVKKL